ncbi:MAG: hypothetical protein EAX96_16215 [Candidatus Lokiarchaeota archaeon]|nr:hypothetical protein [Candidatus Lokiarchaeota archaeon]
MDLEIAADQEFEPKILYLISKYSNVIENSYHEMELDTAELFIKELPLMCLIYEAIVRKAIDYDYAPQSILITNFRMNANISQEGVDDVNDMRELGLIEKLQLTTKHHTIINGYKITDKGLEALKKLTDEDRAPVDQIVYCNECRGLMELKIISQENKKKEDWYDLGDEEIKFVFACKENKTHKFFESSFLDIEDVSYCSKEFYLDNFY